MALGLCAAIGAYGLHVGIEPTLKKFERTEGLYSRLHVTRTIIPMVEDYPGIGVGFGSFRYVYPRYIDDYDRVAASGYAHNDWVETGTETGFPGLFLIFFGFGIYMVRMLRIWYSRRDFYALGIGAGVMAGCLSLGIHSYFDFNMHIPANPLTLGCFVGPGLGGRSPEWTRSQRDFYLQKTQHLSDAAPGGILSRSWCCLLLCRPALQPENIFWPRPHAPPSGIPP